MASPTDVRLVALVELIAQKSELATFIVHVSGAKIGIFSTNL